MRCGRGAGVHGGAGDEAAGYGVGEFDVAKAYMAEGDKAKAEESVLASLEAAPGYKPAQKLLLEIEGK
jgi:Tfp pilus assembly protein PilF